MRLEVIRGDITHERVDVIVDGKQRDRPIAPWSDGQ